MIKRLEPDPDLDDLVRQLNASAREEEAERPGPDATASEPAGPPATPPPHWHLPDPSEEGLDWLEHLLRRARHSGASDLLLVAGSPPVLRIDGRLEPVGERGLAPEGTGLLCAALVPAERRRGLLSSGSSDFSFRKPTLGRFRCNVHRERGHWAAAVRLFPDDPPELERLHLPAALARFTEPLSGLVLVTGPTGCGKSTTLAALIRRILTRRSVHLITIEDPVEYEHRHAGGVVEHVEIGRDVGSYPDALRSVLRQDPDVLLIGEMRDPESMSIAITAAETGHLVFSTLHTMDSPQTIFRILDSYPARQQEAIRAQLSSSLAGIVSQQLLPRRDGKGRVPAVEILVATPAVRNLVRQGRIEQVRSQITLEQQAGMLELDRSLATLVDRGLVDRQTARARARVPEAFDERIGEEDSQTGRR